MSNQPEALLLASALTHPLVYGNTPIAKMAAAELRRLHAVNAELLRELQHLVRLVEPCINDGRASIPGLATFNGAKAAIAKATGEQHGNQ